MPGPSADKVAFYRALEGSAAAGLSGPVAVEPLFEACAPEPFLGEALVLRLLERHAGHKAPPLKVSLATLHALAAWLRDGKTFSEALAHHPEEFQRWELAVLRVGERTGRVDRACAEVADILESRRAELLALAAALAQPMLVQSLIPWIVCAPLLVLGGFWVYLAAASVGLLLLSPAGKLLLASREDGASAFSPGVMPGFCKLLFCRSLAALLAAGVSTEEALAEACAAAGVQLRGEPGEALHARLRRYPMFSSEEIGGLRVCEESGKLDDGLQRLAKDAREQWLAAKAFSPV